MKVRNVDVESTVPEQQQKHTPVPEATDMTTTTPGTSQQETKARKPRFKIYE